MLRIFVSLFLTGSSLQAASITAWDWAHDLQVPLCPTSGVSILDDTYPALAHIVGENIAPEFIRAVLSDSNPHPHVFLQSSSGVFQHIQSNLASKDKARLHLISSQGQLAVYESSWYQDLFAALFQPKSGAPLVARLTGDDEDDQGTAAAQVENIFSALKSFDSKIAYQSDFVDWARMPTTGDLDAQTAGGDISALPGGLCLHGNEQAWDMLSQKYCGSPRNEVILNTSWLEVGHVDEIVSVIPSSKELNSCGFSLAVPAPDLALNLTQSQDWLPTGSLGLRMKALHQSKEQILHLSHLAQTEIDAAKATLQMKLHDRFPNCIIKIVELPVLYMEGERLVLKNGHLVGIPAAVAFTANTVNAVKQDRTYIAEDPILPAFQSRTLELLQSVGVQNLQWIQSDFASRHGSIHCTTHSIRVCRPTSSNVTP